MKGDVPERRLVLLQTYRLLHCVQQGDTGNVEKMLKFGVENLINLTEPQCGLGALHLAAVANNQELVNFLMSRGAQNNIQDSRGRTPLMLAAELGHDSMVAILVGHHCDVKMQDVEGNGVLYYCVSPTKRHARCLQMVLERGADPNSVCHQGAPVLLQLCERALGCLPMCLNLLDKGADPNSTNQVTGVTALMEATKASCLQLVRLLLQKGADPNALDAQNLSVVHYAARGGELEILQLLSAYSADMGVASCYGNTPLHYAATIDNSNCCRFLAQRGCSAKLVNREALLPRHIAQQLGHRAAVKALKKAEKLEQAAAGSSDSKPKQRAAVGPLTQPWALTLHDWSAEHEAAIRQAFQDAISKAVAEEMTRATEESAGATPPEETPVMSPEEMPVVAPPMETISEEAFVSVLRGLGAPADDKQLLEVARRHDGASVGRFLAGTEYLQKDFLLASYLPKKAKGKKGKKKKKGGKKAAEGPVLLPICTVPSKLLRWRDGNPPPHLMEVYLWPGPPQEYVPVVVDQSEKEKVYVNINYCVRGGDLQSLDLAFRRGVPVDVQDPFYKTPLMVACAAGNLSVVRLLLSLGADVRACDQFQWTPLHHAAHAGRADVVQLLLAAGAAPNQVALGGGTPLMRAIESCRPRCVALLLEAGADVAAANRRGQNCLDIAKAFADDRTVELVREKMEALAHSKDLCCTCQRTRPSTTSPRSTSDRCTEEGKGVWNRPCSSDVEDDIPPFIQNIQRLVQEQEANG